MRYILLLSLLLISACEKPAPCLPSFYAGDFVVMKLDGRTAQVIDAWCRSDKYLVRVPVIKIDTNSAFIGKDGPITTAPYVELWVRSFEIKKR